MSAKWYNPREVAQTLSISSSTLRSWASLFAAVLSPTAAAAPELANGQFGSRLYTDSDVTVLTKIDELLRQGLTYQQVAEALHVGYTPRVPHRERIEPKPAALPQTPQETQTTTLPSLGELMGVLHAIASQKERLDQIEAPMIAMEKRLAEEYALLSDYLFVSQSRRSGRWNRYLVWHQSRAVYRFYLGPASEQEIKDWQEHVTGLYLEPNVAR